MIRVYLEKGICDLHASHAQNRDQQDPRLDRHVQPPDEKERQDGENKVANDRDGTVKECEADDDVHINTSAVCDVFVPEEADRVTLKQRDKEEDKSAEDSEAHGNVDDPLVEGFDGDAEKEEANGDLGRNHCPAVGDVA